MTPSSPARIRHRQPVAEWTLCGGAHVVCTGWPHGDTAGDGERVEARRRSAVDLPWTVLVQVHGARVVTVEHPGDCCGEAADAAVSSARGAALAVLSADCAPVALSSPEGVIGVAHAGWRGLRAGVIESTVQSMRRLGATRVEAVLGPCIHPCCYSFGAADLAEVESRLGSPLGATDRHGELSLDLPAGVAVALRAVGASLIDMSRECTAHGDQLWSWRSTQTKRRQATVIWRP